jgi:hypothetical protein
VKKTFAIVAGLALAIGSGGGAEVVSSATIVGITVTCPAVDLGSVVRVTCRGQATGKTTDGLRSVNGVPLDFKPTNKYYKYWAGRVGQDTQCEWSNAFNNKTTWTIPIDHCTPPITVT